MSEIRIVVVQAGNVFIGEYEEVGSKVILSRASVIRRWGTEHGLGQLVSKPTGTTALDPCGFVEVPISSLLFTIRCSPNWPLPSLEY